MLRFWKNKTAAPALSVRFAEDFAYLQPNTYYFDSACQTLRPKQVIDAERAYYEQYNACGGRVKYKWGARVDTEVAAARRALLSLAGKSEREYAVAFTLNTTYGINLVLNQLPKDKFDAIITSEIEHNSVFLPTITWSKERAVQRLVLPRTEKGDLQYENKQLERSVVLLNTMSNIDGRGLPNVKDLCVHAHKQSGIVLLDSAQQFSHNPSMLRDVDFDAAFGSGHKMYGPSIGFIIIKRDLLRSLQISHIGGGTVTDVNKDSYDLIRNDDELHAVLEIGLQNWAGIIGLKRAIEWMHDVRLNGKKSEDHEQELASHLFLSLKKIPEIHLLNTSPSPIVSLYADSIDAHRLAIYLGEQNIMCRSGYFCCHYYLKNLKKYPPLLRISLGLHNTKEQIDHFTDILTRILHAV